MTRRKTKRRRRTRPDQKGSRLWTYVLLGALGVVAVVAVVYMAGNWSATSSPAAPVSTAPQAESGEQAGEIPNPEVPRIPLAEAKDRYDGGTALFVDTRSQEAYKSAHISTAISIPLADL